MNTTFSRNQRESVSKRIDRKTLREIPQKFKDVQNNVADRIDQIEKTLTSSVEGIQKTQVLLHENQLEFSQNLLSHVHMVQKIGEAAESVKKAADTISEVVEVLRSVMAQIPRKGSVARD